MSSEHSPHGDLAGYLVGGLDPEDRAAFEVHLASCDQCRDEARELSATTLALTQLAPPFEVPAGLEARVLAAVAELPDSDAVAREAAPERVVAPAPAWRFRRLAVLGAAGAAAFAAAVVIGTQLGNDDELAPGTPPVELAGTVTTPDGARGGELVVSLLTSGRRVSFDSETLPILPKGDYYELWFVGAGDSVQKPNRISAGTFHPDEQGLTDVDLHAAVDPAVYPRVEITAEPGDGDPGVAGEVVLELDGDDVAERP